MKTRNGLFQILLLAVLGGAFLIQPKTADAGGAISFSYSSGYSGGGHHKGKHGHKKSHYRGHGHNHHRIHHDWFFVNHYEPRPYFPERIYSLPRQAKFVWVSGARYYYYRGIYYQPSVCGTYYTIVDDPYERPQVNNTTINHIYQGNSSQAVGDQAGSQSEFDVNIQNSKGEMVTVKIKKLDNGYIGPQGEFYPEFPKIAQLKEMYTK
ncbi:MAG: hypothetical protein AB7S78_06240 [Candidatus Omnitrophota bacterium]